MEITCKLNNVIGMWLAEVSRKRMPLCNFLSWTTKEKEAKPSWLFLVEIQNYISVGWNKLEQFCRTTAKRDISFWTNGLRKHNFRQVIRKSSYALRKKSWKIPSFTVSILWCPFLQLSFVDLFWKTAKTRIRKCILSYFFYSFTLYIKNLTG